LQGDPNSGEVPLLHERVKNLNEVGQVLIKKFNGILNKYFYIGIYKLHIILLSISKFHTYFIKSHLKILY
jgi:hypothetical protein